MLGWFIAGTTLCDDQALSQTTDRLVYVKDINRNIPTSWRWVRGDLEQVDVAVVVVVVVAVVLVL